MAGTYDGKEVHFLEKSHILGSPLQFLPVQIYRAPLGFVKLDSARQSKIDSVASDRRSPAPSGQGEEEDRFGEVAASPNSQNLMARGIGSLRAKWQLPWKAVLGAGPLLQEWGLDSKNIPFFEKADFDFQYNMGKVEVLAESPSFGFSLKQLEAEWKFDLISDVTLNCLLKEDGGVKGRGSWKTAVDVEFDGKILPYMSFFRCDLSLTKARVDLAALGVSKMEGILEGQGHLSYDGTFESDLDFLASSLKINDHLMENEGPIHLYYSSIKGALFRGLSLHGPFDCIVDLLEYNAVNSHWVFHNAQVHLPGHILTHRFLQFLDTGHDLNFTANIDLASDFSTIMCTMREGSIPFDGSAHPIENLQLLWENGDCKSSFYYLGNLYRFHLDIDDKIAGRLILGEEETPLTIDWEYGNSFKVYSVEGSFSGVDASFHAETEDTLIGSARINLRTVSPLLPPALAQVFEELKMGKGYELKGRLKIENNIPSFQGILAGKSFELFGFQFRTLLAQVSLSKDTIRIFDLKLSDSAGSGKVDEIRMEGKPDQPWTIPIPTLSLHELRPSLLQRPGCPVGPISPLVVRVLTMRDLKGLLADGKTWKAKGELHFINSYKREETIFDLPANVLSRIVGLDLELLIPVCGDLDFVLKDGFYHLTELRNAFSEADRSEFFLEPGQQSTMDLDWNLKIVIKMKQFVLFKLTEAFLISIDGQLDDPQFHLRKKRFFGLM